jgi:hypothetical protein
MKNGGVEKVFMTTREDKNLCTQLNQIDHRLFIIREMVRKGEEVVA